MKKQLLRTCGLAEFHWTTVNLLQSRAIAILCPEMACRLLPSFVVIVLIGCLIVHGAPNDVDRHNDIETTSTTLHLLPNDVRHMILMRIAINDLMSASTTSKSMNEVIKSQWAPLVLMNSRSSGPMIRRAFHHLYTHQRDVDTIHVDERQTRRVMAELCSTSSTNMSMSPDQLRWSLQLFTKESALVIGQVVWRQHMRQWTEQSRSRFNALDDHLRQQTIQSMVDIAANLSHLVVRIRPMQMFISSLNQLLSRNGQMADDDVAPFADIVRSDMIASFNVDDIRLLTLLGVNWVGLVNPSWRYRLESFLERCHSLSIDLIFACLEQRPDIARVVFDNADSPQSLVAINSHQPLNALQMLKYWNGVFDEKLALAKMIVEATGDNAAHLILGEPRNVLKYEIVCANDNVTRLYIDQLALEGRDIFGNDPFGRAFLEEGIQTGRPSYLNILKFAPNICEFLNRPDSNNRTALQHAELVLDGLTGENDAYVLNGVISRYRRLIRDTIADYCRNYSVPMIQYN